MGILADTEVGWHYDQIYLPRPAFGSLLMADTLPPEGGNTEFADMATAYEELPSEVKTRLAGARAVQSYEAFNRAYSVPTNKEQKARSPDIEHPIVRTHPITGRKALYLCPGMTTKIVGWDEAGASPCSTICLNGPSSHATSIPTHGSPVTYCSTMPAPCIAGPLRSKSQAPYEAHDHPASIAWQPGQFARPAPWGLQRLYLSSLPPDSAAGTRWHNIVRLFLTIGAPVPSV